MKNIIDLIIRDKRISVTDLTVFPALLSVYLYENDFALMKEDLKNNSFFISEAEKLEFLLSEDYKELFRHISKPFILFDFLNYLRDFDIKLSDFNHISLNYLIDEVLNRSEYRNNDNVKNIIEFMLELDPTFSPAYELLGSVEIEKGEFENGIIHLEKAIELDPENIAAYTELGEAYFNLGNYKKASEIWEKEIVKSPDNYITYFLTADSYMEIKDYKNAGRILSDFLKIFPDSILGRYEYSLILQKLGDNDEYEKIIKKITCEFPKSKTDIEIWCRIMLENKEFEKTENYLKSFMEKNSDNEHFNLIIMISQLKKGNYENAKKLCKKYKKDYLWYYFSLRNILDGLLNDEEKSIIEFR
ncbi:MAG TPA: tetratricopeptide repeat protein [Tepiditoga sp.]|nr:tetratricopeptide repeat protein [Tepiditoga sp.]